MARAIMGDQMLPVVRLGALLTAAILAVALGVRLGAVDMSMGELTDALLGRGDATRIAIVRELRLPRAIQAALVGAALAASGATLQALLRNPLADPYVLGLSSGAAAGAVVAVVTGLSLRTAWAIPVAAFAGAVGAAALVFRIASGVGRALDMRVLLLAGVVVGAFFNAAILLLLTFADVEAFRSAIFWMMGSHAGATWGSTWILTAHLAVGVLTLVAVARSLDLLSLGEETAAYLGIRVERTKLVALIAASLLAAAAVAASGIIGFVGLIVPHVVRIIWQGTHRFLLSASVMLGAVLLTLADAIARTVAAPTELPIGAVMAGVGVPFFVWLLRRRGAE